MTSSPRSRRRWRALAASTVAVGLVGVGTAVANAATTTPPALGLRVASPTPTIIRHLFPDGESYLESDLAAFVVAGKDPLELRVSRPSYDKPIVAKQVVVKNGKKSEVTLPAGMVTDFAGLKAFQTFTLRNSAGATVFSETGDFCPNNYDSNRIRPDAPDSTPYPEGCSDYHPFLLGNVWGIQAGWASRMSPSAELDVPDGTYKLTIGITPRYRDYFKIPAESAETTVTVTVKSVDESQQRRSAASLRAELLERGAKPNRRAAGNADAHAHADQGDPSKQVAAYSPDLRPPTRRPVTRAAAAQAKGPRPDLRSLPALGISLAKGDELGEGSAADPDRQYVTFGATVWNAGTSPLVVDGFRRTGTDLMDAYQYFYDAKGKQVGSSVAGTMEWDAREGHIHWHFTDFAQYSLLGADKKRVVLSGKESFCLANTDAVNTLLPNAKWRPSNTDLSSSCGQNTAVAVREVLDIGHGDTYGQYLPGQAFDVTDLPNGTYYIEVRANPSKRLAELDTSNNTSLRQVILSGSGADRKLTVPAVFGLDG